MENSKIDNTGLYIQEMQTATVVNPRLSLKYTSLKFTYFTHIFDKYIDGNRFIDSIPRKIIYPLLKHILYLEYLIQNFYIKNSSQPYNNDENFSVKNNLKVFKNLKQKLYKFIDAFSPLVAQNRDNVFHLLYRENLKEIIWFFLKFFFNFFKKSHKFYRRLIKFS